MGVEGVPHGWRVTTLGDVATVVMGQSPPGTTVADWDGRSKGNPQGLPFLQGNAEFGPRLPQPTKWCTDPAKVAEAGDTLISVRAPVGELNLADRRLAIGRGLAAIRFPHAHAEFGWHLIVHTKRGLERLAQGSTFDAVGGSFLRELHILLPPLEEQRRIAAILDAIDAAIERTQAVIDAVEHLRKALLQQLLTRGMPGWHTAYKDVPGVGTIPADWEVVRLGDMLCSADYGTNMALTGEPTGTPVLRMGNLQDGEVVWDDLKWADLAPDDQKTLSLEPGDILFNRTNSLDLVGKVALVRDLPCEASFTSYLIRLRVEPSYATPLWVHAQLHSAEGQARLKRMATKGASQANINPTNLQQLQVPCPSVEEQEATSGVQGVLHDRLIKERRCLDVLTTVKRTVANALLSGRARVPEGLEVGR